MNVLDLFSGIGGFSLGLERSGMRTVAFCEIDPHCRAVLRKHWPGVPIFEDVRNLHAGHVGSVDLICGGFPCQDISLAGRGAGLAGARSGLWSEYRRLIEEIRPRWVVIENVGAIRSRGLDTVLGELAALGYDAEWHCIPASAFGAPHRRDRVWILAYPDSLSGHERRPGDAYEGPRGRDAGGSGIGQDVHEGRALHDTVLGRYGSQEGTLQAGWDGSIDASRWPAEPDVGRVAHGVPSRVDRLSCLGNAVVPQIPEIIGRAIMKAEGL